MFMVYIGRVAFMFVPCGRSALNYDTFNLILLRVQVKINRIGNFEYYVPLELDVLSSTYAINDSLYFPLMCEYRLSETFEVVKTKPKCFSNN